jgi:putative peptidoglycan lipid II flippase
MNSDKETQEGHKKLLRSTLAVSVPTLFSRIFGYLRDMIQAYYMGTGRSADAFTIAYIIPNLLRRLTAEGAMTAAFVPVFSRLKSKESRDELWKFANAFFFDLTVIMAGIVVLGMIFSPLLVKVIGVGFQDAQGKLDLTIALTRMMFPYIFLVSLSALAMAVLNSFHTFFVPALTPVLFNLAVITLAVCFAGRSQEPAYVFAAGVVAGGFLQLAFQLPFLWRKGMNFRFGLSFTHPAVKKVGRLMVPGVIGAGVYQINFALSRMIASLLPEGSVASLYYSSRVQELTLGLFSVALSIALLPTFSDLAAARDYPRMKTTLHFSFRTVSFITFPALVGLVVLNQPIIQVLYQRGQFDAASTVMTSNCLLYFALGLPFISGVKILAPAFYSLKDTRTPVIVASVVMVLYILLALVLMGPLQVGGIALALSISSVFNFLGLYYLMEKKIGPMDKSSFLPSVLKSMFAAVVMGAGVMWVFRFLEYQDADILGKIIRLAAGIVTGITIYFLLSLVINREDLRSLKNMFSRRDIIRAEKREAGGER